jgi:L-threonylcarbamoyladenylate synthase
MDTQVGSNIGIAKKYLDDGFTVGIPTETVYGLAANAFSEDAVSQIFKIKNRPAFDPLIVHVADVDAVHRIVTHIPENAKRLAEEFWPGPLTLILNKTSLISDLVTSGQSTVGVRIPRHALTLALLKSLEYPLAAPSANPFKYVSPTSASHVKHQLGGKLPYILDGGLCEVGLESTIVSFDDETPVILRLGGITEKQIKSICPDMRVKIQHLPDSVTIPGQLLKHYAPSVPFIQITQDQSSIIEENEEIGYLFFNKPNELLLKNSKSSIKWLTQNSNMNEAASNLYLTLRELDGQKLSKVYFEWAPDEGLGKAINDRLERAQSR